MTAHNHDDGVDAATRRRLGLRGRHRDWGQAAVELALALPLVFVVLLAAVQVVLVSRDQLAVVHAAREGARAAAVAAQPAAEGVKAAMSASGLDRARLSASVADDGTRVTVAVRYRSATDVPLVGALIGDVTVVGTATMRVEP
jgi:Flp pilus assembly protein TadG